MLNDLVEDAALQVADDLSAGDNVTAVQDWPKLVKSDEKRSRPERVAVMCGRCMIECPAGSDCENGNEEPGEAIN